MHDEEAGIRVLLENFERAFRASISSASRYIAPPFSYNMKLLALTTFSVLIGVTIGAAVPDNSLNHPQLEGRDGCGPDSDEYSRRINTPCPGTANRVFCNCKHTQVVRSFPAVENTPN